MISSKRRIKTLSGLFIGMAFIFIGNGLILSSAGVMLDKMGVSKFATGAVTSCFYLGAIFSSIFTSKVVSLYGHIRSYAILTAFFAISASLHDMSSNLFYWALLRFMLGFCYYSLIIIIESWINAKSRNEIRSRVIATYEIIYYICFAIGTMILTFDLEIIKIFTLSAFFIILGSVPMNIIKINQPPIPPKQKISIPNVFNVAPLALITGFMAGILVNGFLSMASVYILSSGYSVKEVSLFMSVAMVGGFCSHMFFGFFSDKFGRKYSIMLSSFIGIVVSCAFLFFNLDFKKQVIFIFFLGFGIFCLYSLALARANDVVSDKSQTIKIGSALLLVYSSGSFLAPIIIGGIMQLFGSKAFFALYFVGLIFLLVFSIKQKSIPKEDRVDYSPRNASSLK